MLNLEMEKEHLAKADRDIAEGEQRVARQSDLIDQLRRRGQSVVQAEALLKTLRQTLQVWRDHRQEILRAIARLEVSGSGLAADPAPSS